MKNLAVILSPLALLLSASFAADAKKPNILIFLCDDTGWGEIGYQGATDITTPHIDSIAKNGIRFTQGYVSGPYCSPTRAGLMTGRYQTRFGHEFNSAAAGTNDVGFQDDAVAHGHRNGALDARSRSCGRARQGEGRPEEERQGRHGAPTAASRGDGGPGPRSADASRRAPPVRRP